MPEQPSSSPEQHHAEVLAALEQSKRALETDPAATPTHAFCSQGRRTLLHTMRSSGARSQQLVPSRLVGIGLAVTIFVLITMPVLAGPGTVTESITTIVSTVGNIISTGTKRARPAAGAHRPTESTGGTAPPPANQTLTPAPAVRDVTTGREAIQGVAGSVPRSPTPRAMLAIDGQPPGATSPRATPAVAIPGSGGVNVATGIPATPTAVVAPDQQRRGHIPDSRDQQTPDDVYEPPTSSARRYREESSEERPPVPPAPARPAGATPPPQDPVTPPASKRSTQSGDSGQEQEHRDREEDDAGERGEAPAGLPEPLAEPTATATATPPPSTATPTPTEVAPEPTAIPRPPPPERSMEGSPSRDQSPGREEPPSKDQAPRGAPASRDPESRTNDIRARRGLHQSPRPASATATPLGITLDTWWERREE